MQVYLAAKTQFFNPRPDLISFPDSEGAEALAEFAGRACYESWDRPRADTAKPDGYMHNIMDMGHFSVIEHGTVSFWIEKVPRSLTHELVRHRLFSYSERSQRYVDSADSVIIDPPDIRDLTSLEQEDARKIMRRISDNAKQAYRDLEGILADAGIKGKRRKQAARAALPESADTNIMMTGNHRSWRKFLKKRGSKHADIAIRELAVDIARQLHREFPAIYQDMRIRTLETGETVVELSYIDD